MSKKVWLNKSSSKQRRNQVMEQFTTGLGLNILLANLTFQFGAGVFRDFDYKFLPSTFLLLLIPVSWVFAIVKPDLYFKATKNIMKTLSFIIFTLPALFLLVVLYLFTYPYTRFIGRKLYLKKRFAHTPWITKKGEWRVSTWVDKDFKFQDSDAGPLFALLSFFAEEKSWFLLVMTIILIVVTSFIFFAQSTAIAPFIYTIF